MRVDFVKALESVLARDTRAMKSTHASPPSAIAVCGLHR